MNQFLEKFREIPRGVNLFSVLTLEWMTAVQDAIRALAQGDNITVEGDVTRNRGTAGVRLGAMRRFQTKGRGGAVATCRFGELITIPAEAPADPKRAIRGGVIFCGDKNYNVEPKVLNLTASGTWLIFLRIPVTANIDDAGEILLPGVETSTADDPADFWELLSWSVGPPATQYPNNTRPILGTGVGEIVIPIGKLTVSDGSATLVPARCGNITIDHCAGTLTA